jgi:hypothetical protein
MTTHATNADPISTFLSAVALGTGVPSDIYVTQAVLDATVPHWRFESHGAGAIAQQLSGWYADPGQLFDLSRTELPTGELVRFTLAWNENGNPMSAHQVHVFTVRGRQITQQDAWCGGRWDAALMAEIEADLQLARGSA